MGIGVDVFGHLGGEAVERYRLSNRNGLSAELITYGARLTSLSVPDRDGVFADVVLGFDHLGAYLGEDPYFGATCGRYGNRIAGARFELGGERFHLSANEGENHLHGGARGFDKRIWQAVADEAENAVTFSLVSADGDQGYPGGLHAETRYQLTEDNRLLITMTATTTRPTVVNIVHHSYWNMAGHASGPIHDQILQIAADFYTPVGHGLLATGEIRSVSGTPFDFRAAKPVGADLAAVEIPGTPEGLIVGYDHNFVLGGARGEVTKALEFLDPASGRGLTMASNQPGVQVYSGGDLGPRLTGKGGVPYQPFGGIAFETQTFPGAPNFAHFPSPILNPQQVYRHELEVAFFTR